MDAGIKRIFVIDDNPGSLTLINLALSKSNIVVFVHLLDYAFKQHLESILPIDLILIDIMLKGGLSGFDVFEQIRSQPVLADIPIAFISALLPETQIPRAKNLGAHGYITKPISLDKFPTQINDLIAKKSIWQ